MPMMEYTFTSSDSQASCIYYIPKESKKFNVIRFAKARYFAYISRNTIVKYSGHCTYLLYSQCFTYGHQIPSISIE